MSAMEQRCRWKLADAYGDYQRRYALAQTEADFGWVQMADEAYRTTSELTFILTGQHRPVVVLPFPARASLGTSPVDGEPGGSDD